MSASQQSGRPGGRLLVLGGEIADGSGRALYKADIAISDGRIETIEATDAGPGTRETEPELRPSPGVEVIDATGRVVSPGFIDVHSHDDNAPLLADETAKVLQGVTTEVVGNCGFSLAPLTTEPARRVDELARIRRLVPIEGADWNSMHELFAVTDELGYVTNSAPLVGHGTLRSAVMGLDARPATARELDEMGELLDEALDAGAFGLSSGLMYAPGVFAGTDELVHLTSRLGHSHIYATHMRNESDHLIGSVRESLEVAHRSGCRLQISHLKSAGQRNRGLIHDAIALMDRAREEGIDIHHDVYPYDASSTELASCLPPWAHEGSTAALLERLENPGERERMRAEVEADTPTDWDNAVASCGYEGIVVASTPSGRFEGESIAAIGGRMGLGGFDAMAHVLASEHLEVAVIEFCMAPEDMEASVLADYGMVGSDGLPPGTGGKPHPRRFGTFPRVLRRFVREGGLLSWGQAIRKMTSMPAETFGLRDRGAVRPGMIADLVVFDPLTVTDRGTYDDPIQSPLGIDHVIIGGQVAVRNGRYQAGRHGSRLSPKASA